jgi:hypothetical protein
MVVVVRMARQTIRSHEAIRIGENDAFTARPSKGRVPQPGRRVTLRGHSQVAHSYADPERKASKIVRARFIPALAAQYQLILLLG